MSPLHQIVMFSLLPISILSILLFLISSRPSLHQPLPIPVPYPSPFRITLSPPPRLAYFISGTDKDGPRIFRLLQATYHPRNYYLLHLDQHASHNQRLYLAQLVASVHVFVAAGNVNVVGKADAVNQEGSSSLALLLHGAAILLRWKNDWDWFLNLGPSDYPLLPQDDFLHILSFVPRKFNFIEHNTKLDSDEYQRTLELIVDPRLYIGTRGKMFVGDRKRELPDGFKYFTGSEHVIVSRELVEFSVLGWDNLPRRLLLYLTNTKHAHRGFFQTVACNSEDFTQTVINSNLRYSNNLDLNKLSSIGAPFAANLPENDSSLDMIDSVLLHRSRGKVLPGGWCLGRLSWFGDSCLQWGDFSILRPSPASKLFEKMLVGIIANSTVGLHRCSG